MNDKISILIQAILQKTTEAELKTQLEQIEKKLPKLEIKTDIDKVSQQFKVLADGSKQLNKVTKNTTNELGQQIKTILKVDQETKKLVADTQIVTEDYKKQRLEQQKLLDDFNKKNINAFDYAIKQRELQSQQFSAQLKAQMQQEQELEIEKATTAEIRKQIETYKERLSIRLDDAKTTYGKHFTEEDKNAILSKADLITVENYKDGVAATNLEFDKTVSKSKALRKESTLAMKESDNFITTLSKDFGKLVAWSVVGTALFGTINQIKQGITYITELDNSLNEIRIVTNKSQEEVNKLAESYNNLAKEMSVTTKEIASTAADLYRQGLNDNQVEERMKSIIQYAKISSISISDSNKIITSTANATGESVNKIIDIFAMLGDSTASGADEIGEALQRVASAADNSGISLEKSASWIATISSITRESASTIGRSLNSIISRYESIKEKGFNEEDATQINDVTKALSALGIIAVDSAGQLRPITEIIDELGGKWSGLTKNEQSYIATTLAGTYQRNRLITLMDNYSTSIINYEIALNSAGIAQQKFDIYLESPQAKIDKLKASWEGFIQSTLSSEWIKVTVDGLSTFVSWIDDANVLVPVLAGVIGGVLASSIISLNGGVKALNLELIKTNALTAGIPLLIGLLTTGFTAYTLSISNADKQQKQYLENFKNLNNEYKNNQKTIDKQIESQTAEVGIAQKLTAELEQLSQKTDKTSQEKARMGQIVDQLNQKIPNLALAINSETGELNKQTQEIYKTIEAYKQYLFVQAGSKKATESASTLMNAEDIKKQAQDEIDKNTKIIEMAQDNAEQRFGKNGYIDDTTRAIINTAIKNKNEAQKVLDDTQKIIDQSNADIQKSFEISAKYAQKYGNTYNFDGVKPYTTPDLYTGGGGSSSNSSSVDKNEEKYRLEKDRYMGLTQAINEANNALELNNSLSENASDSEKLKLLDERIILYQNLGKAINDMAWEQQQEANELQEYLKLQGVQFDGNNIIAQSYDDIIDARVAYINSLKSGDERTAATQEVENLKKNAESYMTLVSDKIPKGLRDMLKITGDINKVEADKLDILEKQKKEIEDQIKKAQDYLKDAIKSKDDAKNAEYDLYESVIDILKKEADIRKQNLEDKKYNLEQGQKALEESIDKQKESWEEYFDSQKKKYEDDFDSYKQFVKDKYDTEIENINRQKELLSRSFDDQKYQRDQEERRQKLAKLEERYNTISTDNSGMMEKEKLDLFNEMSDLRKEISEDEQEYIFKNQQNQTDDIVSLKQREKDNLIRYAEENKNRQLQAIEAQKKAQLSALESMRDAQGKTVEDYKNGLAQIALKLRDLEIEERGFADRASAIMSQPFNSIKTFFDEYITKAQLSVTETETLIKKIEELYNTSKNSVQSSAQNALNAIIAAKTAWLAATTDEQRKQAEKIANDTRQDNPWLNNIPGTGANSSLEDTKNVNVGVNDNGVYYDKNTDYAQAIIDAKANGASQSVIDKYIEQRNAKINDSDLSDTEKEELRNFQFDQGGETQRTGLHWLDGKDGEPERVLSATQTKDFNSLVNMIPNVLPTLKNIQNLILPQFSVPKLPSLATVSGNSQPIYLSINMGGVSLANDMDVNKVGEAFGNKIINKLKNVGIGTNMVRSR